MKTLTDFYKYAIDLAGLRKVHKVIKPMLMRNYPENQLGVILKNRLLKAKEIYPKIKSRFLTNPKTTIIQGAGGFERERRFPPTNRIKEISKKFRIPLKKKDNIKLFSKQQEVLNRTGLMHELIETQVKKELPYHSHVSPEVLLRESNLIKSLPEKYKPVKLLYKNLRKDEMKPISKIIPQFTYGEQRLSRHAIKNMTEILKNKKLV